MLIERRNPDTFASIRPGPAGEEAGIRHIVESVRHEGRLAHIVLRSEADDAAWSQAFTAELIDDAQIAEALASAGLRLVRWLDPPRRWSLAEPT